MTDPGLIALRLDAFAGQLGEVRLQAHRLADAAASAQTELEDRLASAKSAVTSVGNRVEDAGVRVRQAEAARVDAEPAVDGVPTRANLSEDAVNGLKRMTRTVRAAWRARGTRARAEIARLESRLAAAKASERAPIEHAIQRWRALDACAAEAMSVCERADALAERAGAQARGVREHGKLAREAFVRSAQHGHVAEARRGEADAAAAEAGQAIGEAVEGATAARDQAQRMGELAESVRGRVAAAGLSLDADVERLRAFDRARG